MLWWLAIACIPCPSSQALAGRAFGVDANVLDPDGRLDGFSGDVPVNGQHRWQITFSASNPQTLTVNVDGQAWEGTGAWDDIECGSFTADWEGVWQGAAGDEHFFRANGSFWTYDDRLDGLVDWAESWTWDTTSGTFNGTAQILGVEEAL